MVDVDNVLVWGQKDDGIDIDEDWGNGDDDDDDFDDDDDDWANGIDDDGDDNNVTAD